MTPTLTNRADGSCEICDQETELKAVAVSPRAEEVALCETCILGVNGGDLDPHHWRALQNSMWSETPAIQVLSYRMLNRLKSEGWALDALDALYLDPELEAWANADMPSDIIHRDSNGVQLNTGDTVVLIKDLPVKGGGFTAKRGTAVPKITLVQDNPEHIEGRVEGQRIVILTQYVKKR